MTLGSISELFLKTHFKELTIANNTSDESFIVPTGYNIYLTAEVNTLSFIEKYKPKEFCTFKAAEPYKKLQWALSNTLPYENQVIAKQQECPNELLRNEFIKYGSFRSGHRLQL